MSGGTCPIGIPDDEQHDTIICGAPAPYYVERWGRLHIPMGLHLCATHAREAIDDGAEVQDDAGDQVLPHPETGELAKVVTIEVCS